MALLAAQLRCLTIRWISTRKTVGSWCQVELSLETVVPLLASPPTEAQKPRISAWLSALKVLLERRYGAAITQEVEPLFLVTAADAVQRRLDKLRQLVDSENAGPFAVRWNPASSLGAWFLPAELASLDDLAGSSGARTYRTPAPNAIRFNNRLRLVDRESSGLESIATDALWED